MAKVKITLNEDHLKLIKEFRVTRIDDVYVGVDSINPYGGTYLMEDLAMILGYWNKAVEGTEKDYDGRKFGLETEIKMIELHNYLMDNIELILSLLFQFSVNGLKPGTYTCIDYIMTWDYKG